MSWGNSCHTLPRIGNHAEAEAFFNEVRPVRGRTVLWEEHQRPLGARPDYNKRIERRETGPGVYYYDLVLYRTALVSYRPDGHILITRYDTQTSRDFISALTPAGLRAVSHCGDTLVRADTPAGPAWYEGGKEPLAFKPCGENQWQLVSEPAPRMREHLCRKQAAAVRKAAKPFLDWVQAHRKLIGRPPNKPAQYGAPRVFESLDHLRDTQVWPEIEPYVGDRNDWMQSAYDTFGARTEQTVSNYEPPKRGRNHEYS